MVIVVAALALIGSVRLWADDRPRGLALAAWMASTIVALLLQTLAYIVVAGRSIPDAIVLTGITIVLVEQSLDFITALSDRILLIQKGSIMGEVSASDAPDPALGTGPFVTTSNDILSLLIYLGMVTGSLKLIA